MTYRGAKQYGDEAGRWEKDGRCLSKLLTRNRSRRCEKSTKNVGHVIQYLGRDLFLLTSLQKSRLILLH